MITRFEHFRSRSAGSRRHVHDPARAAAAQLAACGGGAFNGIGAGHTAADPVQTVAVNAEAPATSHHAGAGQSHAMGLWQPNPRYDTCSQAVHDAFAVVGARWSGATPRGTLPRPSTPTRARECSYHEHGRDPRSLALWPAIRQHFALDATQRCDRPDEPGAVAGLPFGYVNQQLDVYNAQRGYRGRHAP